MAIWAAQPIDENHTAEILILVQLWIKSQFYDKFWLQKWLRDIHFTPGKCKSFNNDHSKKIKSATLRPLRGVNTL